MTDHKPYERTGGMDELLEDIAALLAWHRKERSQP